MDCKEIRSLLSEYLDECLDKDYQTLVEKHLKTCPLCRRELESLRKTVSLVHSLEKVEVPRDFLIGVRKKIERESEVKSFWKRLITPLWIKAPVGGIVTVALCFLILYFANLPPFAKAPLLTTERMEKRTEMAFKYEDKEMEISAESKLVNPEKELTKVDITAGLRYLARIADSHWLSTDFSRSGGEQ